MARIYRLDHSTKGTGASVTPLDGDAQPERQAPPKTVRLGGEAPLKPKKRTAPEVTKTALAPGHVRKKSTGEIGKVQAVDPKAGTATVRWLRTGRTSTVALDSVTRR
jgi:hypothetical protein